MTAYLLASLWQLELLEDCREGSECWVGWVEVGERVVGDRRAVLLLHRRGGSLNDQDIGQDRQFDCVYETRPRSNDRGWA